MRARAPSCMSEEAPILLSSDVLLGCGSDRAPPTYLMAVNGQVGNFLFLWQQLSAEDKAKGLDAFSKPDQRGQPPPLPVSRIGPLTTAAGLHHEYETPRSSSTTFGGVQLSYSTHLFYYPTIHWNLDRSPETDDYWIGIYKKGASNDQYIDYQWLNKTAQGSYYIGSLSTTAGIESTEHGDEFELRLFKGDYQRVDVETNVLRAKILVAPTNPDELTLNDFTVDVKPLQSDVREFIKAIQNVQSCARVRGTSAAHDKASSFQDVQHHWDKFSPLQQQLLYPFLKQNAQPDQIRKSGPKALDRPEPKVLFSSVAKNVRSSGGDRNDSDDVPQKIVLTITLNQCYTYIYPVVNVTEAVPFKDAYIGMYHTQSNTSFNPNGYISWVGIGEQGKTHHLNRIEEHAEGSIKHQYLGVIFDWRGSSYVQIGFASNTILASVSATAAIPPPDFHPNFDKDTALYYARLSQLAYEPYSNVELMLPSYNLQGEMQIYDASTDTNGFIASNDSSVVVVFRGTEIKSWRDIFTDLWFIRKRIVPEKTTTAHGGFIAALNNVYKSIEERLVPSLGNKKLFLAGHSLGGALASLLMYRITLKYPEVTPVIYVYGCPPTGDSDFISHFSGMKSHTITIQNDPVSSGSIILLGPWVGLYKPMHVKYLPKAAGHGIANYIQQIENI